MLSKLKLKYIQSLGQKKSRDEESLFIAEGPKLVKEFLESKTAQVSELFAVEEWINENKNSIGQVFVETVTTDELERISGLATPNKVVAIVHQFAREEPRDIATKIVLALDAIQDPGNFGTIIRIADWFGIENMICSPECADMYNPKVVQATMGSISRVNVFYTDLAIWLSEQKESRIYATVLNGQDITEMQKVRNGIILVGNESKGISSNLLDYANVRITIPGKGNAESLNAGVAVGIVLSHLV
jgi:RNA methyltransferase, TrmH family